MKTISLAITPSPKASQCLNPDSFPQVTLIKHSPFSLLSFHPSLCVPDAVNSHRVSTTCCCCCCLLLLRLSPPPPLQCKPQRWYCVFNSSSVVMQRLSLQAAAAAGHAPSVLYRMVASSRPFQKKRGGGRPASKKCWCVSVGGAREPGAAHWETTSQLFKEQRLAILLLFHWKDLSINLMITEARCLEATHYFPMTTG